MTYLNAWHLPWSTFGNSPCEWFTNFGPFADWIADNDN